MPLNHFQEKFVYFRAVLRFRMERSSQNVSLPHKHGFSIKRCEHFSLFSRLFNHRRAYENAVQLAQTFNLNFSLEGIHLPPESIALNLNINQIQRPEHFLPQNFPRNDYCARAGSINRHSSPRPFFYFSAEAGGIKEV